MGKCTPLPRKRQLGFCRNLAAIDSVVPSRLRAFSMSEGRDFSASMSCFSVAASRWPFADPRAPVSIMRAASCVRKALVEATPISTPALVRKQRSDSRTSVEPGTLQMAATDI